MLCDNTRVTLRLDISIMQDYSVILVIPDYYDRLYVEGLSRLLLIDMGFKQICAQQVLALTAVPLIFAYN